MYPSLAFVIRFSLCPSCSRTKLVKHECAISSSTFARLEVINSTFPFCVRTSFTHVLFPEPTPAISMILFPYSSMSLSISRTSDIYFFFSDSSPCSSIALFSSAIASPFPHLRNFSPALRIRQIFAFSNTQTFKRTSSQLLPVQPNLSCWFISFYRMLFPSLSYHSI